MKVVHKWDIKHRINPHSGLLVLSSDDRMDVLDSDTERLLEQTFRPLHDQDAMLQPTLNNDIFDIMNDLSRKQ